MNIRDYIKSNLKDCNEGDVKETILASINKEDEVVLPGLGVLFEMLWNNCTDDFKNNIVKTLYESSKKA